jgi:hypothetical protein
MLLLPQVRKFLHSLGWRTSLTCHLAPDYVTSKSERRKLLMLFAHHKQILFGSPAFQGSKGRKNDFALPGTAHNRPSCSAPHELPAVAA